jgi:hypothetical protein
MLAGGNGPVTADDKAEGAVSDSWRHFFSEMPHDMFAQADSEGEHPQFAPGKPGKHRRQRKHIEQLRMLKMLELLDLDKDQEISFLTSYNDLRSNIRRVDEARMKLLTELGDKLHNETGTDAEIKNLLEQVDANRQEKQKVETEFIERASTMLSVRQLGKLVMFNEHFERELLDRVRVFREGRLSRERPEGP